MAKNVEFKMKKYFLVLTCTLLTGCVVSNGQVIGTVSSVRRGHIKTDVTLIEKARETHVYFNDELVNEFAPYVGKRIKLTYEVRSFFGKDTFVIEVLDE